MNNFITELRRRNMFRVAGVYGVVGWVVAQVAGVLESALNLPPWLDTVTVGLLLIGFPTALLLAWAFQMTPSGIKRAGSVTEGDRLSPRQRRILDFSILLLLIVVSAVVLWQGIGGLGSAIESTAKKSPEAQRAKLETREITDQRPSIAVLPFDDYSPAGDQSYFAHGISEELLNVLAKIKGLRVVSRTSAFAVQDQNIGIEEIAAALQVNHILEGSVRKAGSTLRITAQLIDTKNDAHLWSQTYDRPLSAENIFLIQDDITAAIVGKIADILQPETDHAKMRTSSLEAYEYYLRGREQMNQRKPKSLTVAVENFSQAITIDPDYALAFAGLADTYLLMESYADMPTEQSILMARPNVKRALELAPNSAEALSAAALLALNEGRDKDALELSHRAIAANPSFSDGYLRQALAYFNLGETEEELKALQTARALDPLSGIILNNLAGAYSDLGNRVAAKQANRQNIHWNPQSPYGYSDLAVMLLEEGALGEAHILLKDAQALNSDDALVQTLLTRLYTRIGLFDLAINLASERVLIDLLQGKLTQIPPSKIDEMDNLTKAYVLYLLQDFPASYENFKQTVSQNYWEEQPILPEFIDMAAIASFVYRHQSDSKASALADKVENILSDNSLYNTDL
ncbi:MAG: hypothetical protein L3J04_09590, partial [Robiginitomaculum sp.]|nr:hypothetical protein [Robiginitomaculum sp.]